MSGPMDAEANRISSLIAHKLNPFDMDWPAIADDSPYGGLSVEEARHSVEGPHAKETSAGKAISNGNPNPPTPPLHFDVFGHGDGETI